MIKKIITYVAALTAILFIGSHVLVFRPGVFERITATIAYPFYTAGQAITSRLQAMRQHTLSYQQLQTNFANLQARHEELFAAYVEQQCSAHLYKNVSELIEFRQRYNFQQALVAKVLARCLTEQEQTLTINRGTQDGVTIDMIAIFKLQLLGKIVEVHPYYSKVMLLTDRRCKIAGFTNTTNAGGIVQGRNDSAVCSMLYVSHLSTIADEDFVFSSGQGLVFPEGFCLGKITQHSLQEKALYHEIIVQPLIDITSVAYCIIADQTKIALF